MILNDTPAATMTKTKNILLNENDTPAATITKTKNYEKA